MNAEIIARLEASFDPQANKDEQIEWLHDYVESQARERTKLYDALNSQHLILEELKNAHSTMTILARAVGEAFLRDGSKDEIFQIMARALADIEIYISTGPSEKVPKRSWED